MHWIFGRDCENPCLVQNMSKIQKKPKKENRNTNYFTSQGKLMLISKHSLLGFVVVVVKFAYSLPIFPLGLVSFSHLTKKLFTYNEKLVLCLVSDLQTIFPWSLIILLLMFLVFVVAMQK